MSPLDTSLFKDEELKELLANVQIALKEELYSVAGLPPELIPLNRSLNIRRLESDIITYKREIELRAQKTGGSNKAVKILFLAASPDDLAHLALDKEVRGIQERLRTGEHRERFELVSEVAVRVSEVSGFLLQHKPTIVHFSGHGDSEGRLQLQDRQDQAFGVPIAAFADLFELFKTTTRCVVLNACYSDQMAVALACHIDCVVGMTSSVRDDSAIIFAEDFYRALSFGQSLQTAFKLGCIAIHLHNTGQQGIPKLHARSGVRLEDMVLAG